MGDAFQPARIDVLLMIKCSGFGGQRILGEACRDGFTYGVASRNSTHVVPFGDKLAAAPLSSLRS